MLSSAPALITPPPSHNALVVGSRAPAYDPVTRLQVLERLLNRVSPGGQRLPDEMFAEPTGPLSGAVLSRGTSWYVPLTKLRNASDAASREAALYALVLGFVEDIECAIVYSAAEHLATQSSFLTSGHAERATLDFQIRLSNVSADLEELGKRIGYARPDVQQRPAATADRGGAAGKVGGKAGGGGGGHHGGRGRGGIGGEAATATYTNVSLWKCPLGRENEGARKAKLPVRKEDFVRVLREAPSLTQRLCTVYIQDYLCLGYSLPPECEGGRELSWLSRAGASSTTAVSAVPSDS